MDITGYWQAVLDQDAAAMRRFFADDAVIRWHNTNECFTVDEFIRANCEYPGEWTGRQERIVRSVEYSGECSAAKPVELIVTAMLVTTKDKRLSFHVTSFIRAVDGLITSLDEYWGDDGPAPEWRRELNIGRPIR